MRVDYTLDIDMSEFNKFVKDVNLAYAEVGVLGSGKLNAKNDKKKKGKLNAKDKKKKKTTIAEYGAAHEFGVIKHNLPRRSFIKDPLESHLGEEVQTIRETLLKLLEAGDIKKAVRILGLKGVEIIKKAFETSNDGKWQPLSETTIAMMSKERQKGWKILVDTGALQSSITSKVVVK